VQAPCSSGPTQAPNVIDLDNPRDFIEISSSLYNLSLFSSKDGSYHDRGVDAAPRKSSNVVTGDLWLEIDSSHGANREGTIVSAMRSHLEASASWSLSGIEGSKKRTIN
jgi:hypothetical protein